MIDKAIFKLPGIRPILIMLIFHAIAQALLVLVQSASLALAITRIWEGQSISDVFTLILIFLACFISGALLLYIMESKMYTFAAICAQQIRSQLLESIFQSKAHAAQDNGTAYITSAVLEGVEQVEEYIVLVLPRMINLAIVPTIILITTFIFDVITGIILLVMFPVIIAYMILLGSIAKSKAEKQYDTYKVMENNFIDTLRGIDTLEAFGQTKQKSKEVFDTSEKFREATIGTIKIGTLSNAVLDLIATASIGAISLMLAMHILDMKFGLFVGLVLLILSPEYFKPIREFASDFHATLNGKNALKAITQIIEQSRAHIQDTQTKLATYSASSSLTLEDITYTYPQAFHVDVKEYDNTNDSTAHKEAPQAEAEPQQHIAHEALSHISLSTNGFEKIGIVGASGCGKSTLIKLLSGFIYPTSGKISIDGTNVDHLDIASWQQVSHFIPQHPYIFHASLKDNIAFYTPDASQEEIERVISLVGLDTLVNDLPLGLDTIIGEQGRGLSGGQAQRIALARAFLDKQRTVLFLDEPTAHLDIETEFELKEKMLPLMNERLVFFATHRLHWLKEMDRIYVLDNGSIVEHGTYEDLMTSRGALFNFVQTLQGGSK